MKPAAAIPRHALWCGALALLLATPALAGAGADPLAITTNERPWLSEADFAADGTLHATERQSVVLDLEDRAAGRAAIHVNTIRLLLERPQQISLCIAADEPYIVRAQLRREARQSGSVNGAGKATPAKTVVTWHRGGSCTPVQADAGSYTLNVFHDTREVVAGGVHAFLHRPAGESVTGDSASPASLAFMVFKGPDGHYVTNDSFVLGSADLATVGTVVDASSVWQIVGGPSPFGLENGSGQRVNIQVNGPGVQCPSTLYIGSQGNGPICGDTPVQLTLSGTAEQFGLSAVGANQFYSIDIPVLVEGGILQYSFNPYGDTPALMSADYRGFHCPNDNCAGSGLVLQAGEVALFAECNFTGPAVVFQADVPDFSIYDTAAALGFGIGDGTAASLRVGPDTLVALYDGTRYDGATLQTTADIPCLAGTALGSGSVTSMQLIQNAAAYVVATNACVNCNLSGIDLAGADLAGGRFPGANFTGASLTGTRLPLADLYAATLSGAALSGADFTGADLRCADLSATDLTAVELGRTEMFPVVTDYDLSAIVSVDLVGGARQILAGPGVGSGPSLAGVVAARDDGGASLLAITSASGNPTLVRIAVASGDRSVVSGSGVGSGSAFGVPVDLAVAANGTILVLDTTRGLVRVDPASGDRTIISGPRTGSGPSLLGSLGMALDDDGSVLIAANSLGVLRVDPTTGDRTVLSGSGVGSGPLFSQAIAIAVAADGSLAVTDDGLTALMKVDPATGDRTLISGAGAGSGPAFQDVSGLAVTVQGQWLVVDTNQAAVIGVDPATGARIVVSGAGVGGGPTFSAPVNVAMLDPSPTVVTDSSCRLDLRDATLALATFPLNYWRYLDLSGATIQGAAGATISSSSAPLDLSGARLNGVNLGGAILDSVNLGCYPGLSVQTDVCPPPGATPVCAVLQGTDLSGASLKNACLQGASLQGADLGFANFDGSEFDGATLQALPSGSPATLTGAFLRDASLRDTNLTGVIANSANFFSSSSGTADASDATMTGSKWNNAYLAGADFSNAVLQSSEWTGAVLVGANFNGADLSKNTTAGEITDFGGAYLQGAVFSNAVVTDADFTSSYWDTTGIGTLNILLQPGNLEFAGYWNDPTAPECVQATYPDDNYPSPGTPITSISNICPDGGEGPCDGVWDRPRTPIDQAIPQSAVPPAFPGSCLTSDFLWIFPIN